MIEQSFEAYRNDPCMNASTIVHGFHSLKRLKRAIDGSERPATPEMIFGQMYHCAILEPEQFKATYQVLPDFKSHPDNKKADGERSFNSTKWSKAQTEKWLQENGDPITQDELSRIDSIVDSLRSHDSITEILRQSRKEVTLHGKICHTEFKARVDLLDLDGEWGITDLKGTNDVSPWKFGSLACRLHYPERLAIYRKLAEQEFGRVLPVHIAAVETDGDFDRALFPIREPILDHAFSRVSRLVLEYEDAMKSGKWPGIDKGAPIVEFAVPNHWMPAEEMDWS